MGMLEQAAAWLESQRQQNLTVPAIYIRKSGEVILLDVSLGRTIFRAENEYGVTIRTESRDFLIATTNLPNTPERGDEIHFHNRRYEVLAPNGEPVWRWSGACNLKRRIHTKEIGDV